MLIIGNGRMITRDRDCPYIERGAVVIEGDAILEVGEYEPLRQKHPHADLIDARGKVIMPGLINAHHHIYSAFARGISLPGPQPENFPRILEQVWWRIDRKLTLEQTYFSAVAAYMECIRNGVTTVIDHHAGYGAITGSLFEIAKAAKLLGVRTCLAYEISDRDGRDKMREAVRESAAFTAYEQEQGGSMLKSLMGLHASFTLSDETLDYCRAQNRFNRGYHIHVAEGIEDEDHCRRLYGCSVVERLHRKGILGRNTIAGHAIHISSSDMALLQATGTTVVHNPQSNMANAVGCPDILKMLDQGIGVGLGTDGYTNDMLESMKTAHILQKHHHQDPRRGFTEAAEMLFGHNSRIASGIFSRTVGCLKAGAAADVIIMDYSPYTPMNRDNIEGHIQFGMSGAMTDSTVINGRIVMKDRILQIEDEPQLLEQCARSARDLWRSLD